MLCFVGCGLKVRKCDRNEGALIAINTGCITESFKGQTKFFRAEVSSNQLIAITSDGGDVRGLICKLKYWGLLENIFFNWNFVNWWNKLFPRNSYWNTVNREESSDWITKISVKRCYHSLAIQFTAICFFQSWFCINYLSKNTWNGKLYKILRFKTFSSSSTKK